MRTTWSELPDDARVAIRGSILELTFASPPDIRRQLIAALRFVVIRDDGGDVAAFALQQLSGSQSLGTINAALAILYLFVRHVTVRNDDDSESFAGTLLPVLAELTGGLAVDSAEAFSAARSIAGCLRRLVDGAQEAFASHAAIGLLRWLVNAMQVVSVDNNAIEMKKAICKLLTKVVSMVRSDSTGARLAFFDAFQTVVLPEIVNAIPAVFASVQQHENGKVDNMLAELLRLVQAFVVKESPAAQAIVTPEFIQSILIPCALLRPSDIQEFNESPELFRAAAMSGHSLNVHPYVIRAACAELVFRLRRMLKLAPILSPETAQDTRDFEARVYLIAHCHEKIRMDADLYAFLTEQVYGILAQDDALFAAPSLLLALQNVRMDPITARNLGYEVFMGIDQPVIMLEAVGLIDMALRRHSPLEGIDVGAFVGRLLHLGSIVNDEAVGIVLGNLIRNFPDEVLPFATEMF
jgi:hypothetical protein